MSEWQPIETGDREHVILGCRVNKRQGWLWGRCRWVPEKVTPDLGVGAIPGGYWFCHEIGFEPTHWMPLPSPPLPAPPAVESREG